MAVKLVVFDLAGTTVDDSLNGLPLVTVAMKDAFGKHGHTVDAEIVNTYRGMEKKDALRCILKKLEVQHMELSEEDFVEVIFKDFKDSLNQHLMSIKSEIRGTSAVFQQLKSSGVKIAVGSGFPHSVVEAIVARMAWTGLVDYISSAEREGHGRPHPSMVLSAMRVCGVSDPRSVLKVGDTKADIEEGKNANCWTVAVLTGTQSENTLRSCCPDFVVDSVADLPVLLSNWKSQIPPQLLA